MFYRLKTGILESWRHERLFLINSDNEKKKVEKPHFIVASHLQMFEQNIVATFPAAHAQGTGLCSFRQGRMLKHHFSLLKTTKTRPLRMRCGKADHVFQIFETNLKV